MKKRNYLKGFIFDENGLDKPGSDTTALADVHVSPEGQRWGQLTQFTFLNDVQHRFTSVYLGKEDYQKVGRESNVLINDLLMECLPRFIHAIDGEIISVLHLEEHAECLISPVLYSLKLDNQTCSIVREGTYLIHFKEERVTVTSKEAGRGGYQIRVCSNMDSSKFLAKWEEYTRQHNYLRTRAFFADGRILERKKTYGWDDILLGDKVKRLIRRHVNGFLSNRDRLKNLGLKTKRGLIFAGAPGTGKTLLGKILADTLDVSFIWVSPRHIQEPSSFEAILSLARFTAPVVLFLEDLDLFAEDRELAGGQGLGELMNQLDGAVDNEDILTIATTNRLDVIEQALRNRPGRFDRVVEFGDMDETCRRLLLEKLLARADISTIDLEHLIQSTRGYTGAQLEELVNTLYLVALEHQESPSENGDEKGISMTRQFMKIALDELRVEKKVRLGFEVA